MKFLEKLRCLSGNQLKLLAAVCMLIDHAGVLLFPHVFALRIIGRVSFPIFALMIAEGCRYTRHKLKHFLLIFVAGIVYQIVFYIASKDTYLNILITFSLSIIVVYSLQFFKKLLFDKEAALWKQIASGALFLGSIVLVRFLCEYGPAHDLYEVDTGFWGCMLPVFASLFDFKNTAPPPLRHVQLDCLFVRELCLILGCVLMHVFSPYPELTMHVFWFLPLLLLYNGERGKRNMKYFFHIFYPAHFVLLMGIYTLMQL